MATILGRVKQLIFGSTGDVAGFGKIGSKIAGSPVKTKDLAQIQSLSLYLQGLQAITNSNLPYLQDTNSLFLLITSQLAYYFQNCVPEYDATTDYFNLISFVQVNGVVYQSIFGDGTTPNTGNAPASSPTKWRNVDPYTIAQAVSAETTRAEAAEGANAAAIAAETARAEAAEAAISGASGLAYVQQTVAEAGMTWDATDAYLLDKAIIANAHAVGEMREFDSEQTQVIFSAARSSAHPSYPRYNPIISRAVDKTLAPAVGPVVGVLRARMLSVLGTTGFACTVSGGNTLTFASTTTLNAFLNAVYQEGLVRRWFSSSQSATFANLGADYTGMTVTALVSGVATEVAISAVNTGARTIAVSGASVDNGAQTISVYPHRIVGSTSAFLPGLAGFISVQASDVDGLENGMYRHMFFDHEHIHYITSASALTGPGNGGYNNGPSYNQPTSGMIDNGSSGAPRPYKIATPNSNSVYKYIHAGYLTATA